MSYNMDELHGRALTEAELIELYNEWVAGGKTSGQLKAALFNKIGNAVNGAIADFNRAKYGVDVRERITDIAALLTGFLNQVVSDGQSIVDAAAFLNQLPAVITSLNDTLSVDILENLTRTDSEGYNISFTWNGNSCAVDGKPTQNVFNNIYGNANQLPNGVSAGETYLVIYESTNVRLQIYSYTSGGSGTMIFNSTHTDVVTIPDGTVGMTVRLWVAKDTEVDETVCAKMIGGAALEAMRLSHINHSDWSILGTTAGSHDCNDIKHNSVIFVSTDGSGDYFYDNFAAIGSGWLITTVIGTDGTVGILQQAFPFNSTSNKPQFRTCRRGAWTKWQTLSDSGNHNTYNNTYNITTSPSFTTDTNGWLQPIDTDTQDETGKTDMTGAIMSLLTNTGYCHLAPGIYYVSGSIDMPEGSTLEGCGNNTVIRLLSSVTSGYCVRVGRYNTVRNIRFSGGYGEGSVADVASSTIGSRNGIHFIANKDGQESAQPTVKPCRIDTCWFERFSGSAIYQHNTGGGIPEILMVSNCYIQYCEAGINIDYFSEYCKYTNVVTFRCYYACINNGGNNVFVGCTFHGAIGFLLDNSNSDKYNDSHGSAIGCTFNHIDNWNRPSTLGMGDAVLIKKSTCGFVFSGCQLWYGEINIQNSRGITFANCIIGGGVPTITVTGSKPAFFNGCIFYTAPTISDEAGSKFDNCYHDLTGDSVPAS